MKKRIYIAGKVTGERRHTCALKFAIAQKEVEALGFEAINPLEVVNDWNADWESAMRSCIAALMQCDGILFLPCAMYSKGATLEFMITENVGIIRYASIEDLRGLKPVKNRISETETVDSLNAIGAEVIKEVKRAKTMFPANFVNQHEAYAVILEEVDELWDEIKKNQRNYDLPAQRKEAIQVAAMAIRFINELTPLS